ncbi:GntR family transcriptional regulator [Acidobacteriota bacterium]
MPKKNKSKTLREIVYDKLKKKIIYGDIVPGETISVGSLAKEFGTSLIPVREALFQLDAENAISIDTNKGYRVNSLTVKELKDAYLIRKYLESIAVERACELRPDKGIKTLESILKNMQTAIDTPKKFQILNNQFHFQIYEYAYSPLLIHIIEMLWVRVGPYLWMFNQLQVPHKVLDTHKEMFEALVERDKDRMTKALRDDLELVEKNLIPFLEIQRH